MLEILSAIVLAAGSVGLYNSVSDAQVAAAADNAPKVIQTQLGDTESTPEEGDLGW